MSSISSGLESRQHLKIGDVEDFRFSTSPSDWDYQARDCFAFERPLKETLKYRKYRKYRNDSIMIIMII